MKEWHPIEYDDDEAVLFCPCCGARTHQEPPVERGLDAGEPLCCDACYIPGVEAEDEEYLKKIGMKTIIEHWNKEAAKQRAETNKWRESHEDF